MRNAESSRRPGLDSVCALTPEFLRAIRKSGYHWVARYLPRDGRRLENPDTGGGDYNGCWTLSQSEVRAIIAAELALVPVQWGPDRPLTQDRGSIAGRWAASYARWLGLPSGVHLWCDLEGKHATAAGASGCREYLDAWSASVVAGGYLAGLYVGPGVPLTGSELYRLPGYTAYWCSATQDSRAKEPLPRGYSIYQGFMDEIAGVVVDPDMATITPRGDWFRWVAP